MISLEWGTGLGNMIYFKQFFVIFRSIAVPVYAKPQISYHEVGDIISIPGSSAIPIKMSRPKLIRHQSLSQVYWYLFISPGGCFLECTLIKSSTSIDTITSSTSAFIRIHWSENSLLIKLFIIYELLLFCLGRIRKIWSHCRTKTNNGEDSKWFL